MLLKTQVNNCNLMLCLKVELLEARICKFIIFNKEERMICKSLQ